MTAPVEARQSGVSAAVAAELQRLVDEHGSLTADLVLAAAADESSALHSRFTWDDDVAAEKWRHREATTLVRQVKVTVVQGERRVVVPAYVSVVESTGLRVRVPTGRAMADPELWPQVLAETRQQLAGLRNRLSAFDEAAPVLAAIDAALAAA